MKIKFKCPWCEHDSWAREEDEGKKGKCAKCGKLLRMPGKSGVAKKVVASAPPPASKKPPRPAAPAPAPREDEELAFDSPDAAEAIRPTRRAARSTDRKMLWLVGGGVGAVVVLAAGAYLLFFRGDGTAGPKVAPPVQIAAPPPAPPELKAADLAGEWGDFRKDGLELGLQANGKGAYSLVTARAGADVEVAVGDASVSGTAVQLRVSGNLVFLSARLLDNGAKLELTNSERKLHYVLNRKKPSDTEGQTAKAKEEAPKEKGAKGPLPLAPDLARVPGDTSLFVSVSGELLKAPPLAQFRKKYHSMEAAFTKDLGLSLDQVERLSLVLWGAVDEVRFEEGLHVVALGMTKEVLNFDVANKVSTTLTALGSVGGVSFTFDKDRVFVIGVSKAEQNFKNAKELPRPAGALQRALERANTSKGIVALAVIPPAVAEMARKLQKADPKAPRLPDALFKASEVMLELTLTDSLKLDLSLTTIDAAAAEELKKEAFALLGRAKAYLPTLAKDPALKELVPVAEKALANIKIDADNQRVTLSLHADPELTSLAANLLEKTFK